LERNDQVAVLVVLSTLPIEFPDKRAALIGAFLNGFGGGAIPRRRHRDGQRAGEGSE
jgi:hypothetical protein